MHLGSFYRHAEDIISQSIKQKSFLSVLTRVYSTEETKTFGTNVFVLQVVWMFKILDSFIFKHFLSDNLNEVGPKFFASNVTCNMVPGAWEWILSWTEQ